ncbi:MAG: galactonate dehydratase [Acidimicrobiales bacterium]
MIWDIETFRVPPRWIFVKVTTDDGAHGWGEAIVPKRSRAVVGAVEDLASNVRGADPSRIEDLWQRMRRGAFFRGGPVLSTAAAAVEQALWDIKGRRYGLAVYDFLGGATREEVRVYSWIGGDQPDHVGEDTRLRMAQGYTAVKMNATAELDYIDRSSLVDAVVERVATVREAGGPGLGLAVDFHGRVHRSMAKVILRELEQFDLMWVEEPLGPGYEGTLAELGAAAGRTPLATGERLCSRWEFRDLLAHGAVDIVQPDVSITGLFELEKICRIAEAYDVMVAPHCPNGPVSLAASLQVDCCTANVSIQEQSLGMHYNLGYGESPPGEMGEYLIDPSPLAPIGGRLLRPKGPGLGIEVDEGVVRERAAAWELLDPVWRHPDGRLAEW